MHVIKVTYLAGLKYIDIDSDFWPNIFLVFMSLGVCPLCHDLPAQIFP